MPDRYRHAGSAELDASGSPRPLRLLFLSWRELDNPRAGGSEVLVDRLVRGVIDAGHRAALVCGGPVGRREYPVMAAGGTYDQYLRAPFVARRFRHWDVLVEVVNGFPYFSPLWWPGPRVCIFNHVHGPQWYLHFPRPIAASGWFVEREVLPRLYRSTQFATISPSTRTALRGLGVPAGNVASLHLGLDPHLFELSGRSRDEPLFVVVSRLTPNKRVGAILDAWEQVHPVAGGRLVVIGDGPERGALEARRVPGVELPGFLDESEKLELIDRARLLVHAAANEGWGLVVMEAAARGTPVLAVDANGVRDAVEDGVTGVLVRSTDDLARAWLELAADQERLDELGSAARLRALGYTWERTTSELLEVVARARAGSR